MVQVSHCVITTATTDEVAAASTVPQRAQSVASEDGIAKAWRRNNLSVVRVLRAETGTREVQELRDVTASCGLFGILLFIRIDV